MCADLSEDPVAAQDLDKLAMLIRRDRDALLGEWRKKVKDLPSAKHLDAPTLNDHLPALLEELAVALEERSGVTIAEALREGSPRDHGLQRLKDGFDIAEVVAEYNILRDSIHDLAEANGLNLQGEAFHILNRVLDGAIGLAVETYATQRASEVRSRREEYLAFVAHDLRTPLNAMSLAARVLDLTAEKGNPESARMIRSLHRNALYIEKLVGKVLDENKGFQTEGAPKLQRRSFDLWPLVEGIIHDIHPVAAGTDSAVLINKVPEDLVVFADAGLLGRVLQNLITNAIAYTPRGEVTIGAQVNEPDGTVECWVSDNGAGIPGDLLDKVFEKGESDPEKNGTGLGLAIVRTFVEAHGGTVHVESKEGQGATIRFTLPSSSTTQAVA